MSKKAKPVLNIDNPTKPKNRLKLNMGNLPSSISLLSVPLDKLIMSSNTFQTQTIDSMYNQLLYIPKGIYASDKLEPVIHENEIYIIENEGLERRGKDLDLDALLKGKSKVMDLADNIVLEPNTRIKYSYKPFIPYIGTYLLAIWIIRTVNFMTYKNGYGLNELIYYNKIFKGIDPESDLLDKVVEDLEEVFAHERIRKDKRSEPDYEDSSLLLNIEQFIGKDKYSIYSLDINNSYIVINKHVDFRIYEWTLGKENNGY